MPKIKKDRPGACGCINSADIIIMSALGFTAREIGRGLGVPAREVREVQVRLKALLLEDAAEQNQKGPRRRNHDQVK